MNIRILNALVCDPTSPHHNQVVHISIEDGKITAVKSTKSKSTDSVKKSTEIDVKGQQVSPGWMDLRMALRDPGFEFKESLQSASAAAMAGGFTTVGCLPVTNPPIHSKSEVSYILNASKHLPVSFIPYGCISHHREGKELAELYDMFQTGAPAFTDGNKPVSQAGLMMRALLYSRTFGGLIMSHAEDLSLSASGRMHEGLVSTRIGVKGIPSISEELMIERDLELANYCESAIHFSHISSKGSVERIRKAKKRGIPVTCDVSIAHLCFTEEQLADFNSMYKVNPPLRSKDDRKALWDGLWDGTIDCIVTDHQPENKENKEVEFEYASQGMINLQTAFSLYCMFKPKSFQTEHFIQAAAIRPREIIKQPSCSIKEGNEANLTFFMPEEKWNYTLQTNRSQSENHPLLGQTLTGKAVGIFSKGKYYSTK